MVSEPMALDLGFEMQWEVEGLTEVHRGGSKPSQGSRSNLIPYGLCKEPPGKDRTAGFQGPLEVSVVGSAGHDSRFEELQAIRSSSKNKAATIETCVDENPHSGSQNRRSIAS
eukprot:Gb_01489 [translate_table: standard]